MRTRQEAIQYCHSFQDVYEDYPFHDDNWCVMRHKNNKKTFAPIYDKDEYVWINVKCDPDWREFWRNAFESVVPADRKGAQMKAPSERAPRSKYVGGVLE